MTFTPVVPSRLRFAVRTVLFAAAFLVLLMLLQLGVGQWNRNQARDWVFRRGGTVATTPSIPETFATWLPGDSREWFWNFELVAFNDRSFDNGGLSALSRIPGLHTVRKLYLNGTGVNDAVLPELAAWPTLRELYLEDTSVSDSGLVFIGNHPALRIVSVRNTRVTPKGIARLHRDAPQIEVLGSINMRGGEDSTSSGGRL